MARFFFPSGMGPSQTSKRVTSDERLGADTFQDGPGLDLARDHDRQVAEDGRQARNPRVPGISRAASASAGKDRSR